MMAQDSIIKGFTEVGSVHGKRVQAAQGRPPSALVAAVGIDDNHADRDIMI